MMRNNMELVTSVQEFMAIAGQTREGEYNEKQIALYIGLQFEELAEKMEALELDVYADMLHNCANAFKNPSPRYLDAIATADREALLDADIDLAWVTIGAAISTGAQVEAAITEVASSNLGKFPVCTNCGGAGGFIEQHDEGMETIECDCCNGMGRLVIKDSNGKVQKPAGWKKPELAEFIVG